MGRIVLFVLVSLIGGCATEQPFPQFQGNVEAKSQHVAGVTLVHGVMLVKREGPTFAVGGAFVTVPGGWNANDQPYIDYYRKKHHDFVAAFCAELERLGMFKKAEIVAELPAMPTSVDSATASIKTSDTPITIQYVTTSYNNAGMNYTLDVVLTIGSERPFVRKYHIESNNGESFWMKMNNSGPQARHSADTQLVDALINDIQVWLKADTTGG